MGVLQIEFSFCFFRCLYRPHYGAEYRIELINAANDECIGACVLPTQALLQQQRDYLIEERGLSFFAFVRENARFDERLPRRIRFRAGMENADSRSYFASNSNEDEDVVAVADILVGMEENWGSLYGSNPYTCPDRPQSKVDLTMFQRHISRISVLMEDLNSLIAAYIYMISWKNQMLTFSSLVGFLYGWTFFNPEYFGSLPTFFVIVAMVYSGTCRFAFGRRRDAFVAKEVNRRRKVCVVEVVTLCYMHPPYSSLLSMRRLKAS